MRRDALKTRAVPAFLARRIRALPDTPGVYIFKGTHGKAVYIGKAVALKKRVLSHFRFYGENRSKEGVMLGEVRRIDILRTPTEAEALLLEASLIKEKQPKYNREQKDDKSYPYLKITREKFPRLLLVRGRPSDGGRYFGPYTNVRLLKEALKMLRRLFPMRTCHPLPDKVCLMYHIEQCQGPCVNAVSETAYNATVRELTSFLAGRRDALVRNLARQMKRYSERREYEKAKTLYEQIKALSHVPHNPWTEGAGPAVLESLKRLFALPALPRRVEGFDISNIAGQEAVGSLVVFENAKPARARYRRFRIRSVRGIDDYEMMREVVRRRYTRLLKEGDALPDLVVIDGGKGHLAAAKGELDALGLETLPVISIAKQHEHLFHPNRSTPYVLPQSSPILHLIQHLRDEAHRFAIQYHRKLHKREAMLSLLDTVPGVGPKTKQKLLTAFGSLAKIKAASAEELALGGGVSRKTASQIENVLSCSLPEDTA